MGNYLVFLASTINGYEGTGRSLSLKLLEQLRQQAAGGGDGPAKVKVKNSLRRALYEISLEESIRYNSGDKVGCVITLHMWMSQYEFCYVYKQKLLFN